VEVIVDHGQLIVKKLCPKIFHLRNFLKDLKYCRLFLPTSQPSTAVIAEESKSESTEPLVLMVNENGE